VRQQLEGSDIWVQPDPIVRTCRLALTPPSKDDARGDLDRLLEAVRGEGLQVEACDAHVLRALPYILRDNNWCVQVVLRLGEIIAVQPGNTRLVGLAIDLGTTNIGLSLADLRSGTTIASAGFDNPQRTYGGDVVTRIATAAKSPEKAQHMQELVVQAVNTAVAALCDKRKLPPDCISDIVLAGNTAMHHLALGLPVEHLGKVPFVPSVTGALDLRARDLGLVAAPGAYVHALPNIAGYVGGDHSAMLLGIRAGDEARTIVALDIGTNTEITLIHQGRMSCLSTPSGPALEGGHITSGMRAAIGAIEAVRITNAELQIETIGGAEPAGLCGSGVIDAMAAFYADGGITPNGRIQEHYRFARDSGAGREFVLHEGESEVIYSQDDVRAVQLAKGAIRAGIEILLEGEGLGTDDIERVVVAGTFGNFIDIRSACRIGMLPDLPPDRFEQIGNAAGIGAKLALVSFPLRLEAQQLAASNRYIELAASRKFTSCFMKHIGLPPSGEPDSGGEAQGVQTT